MLMELFEITGRAKPHPAAAAAPEDFHLAPAGQIPAAEVAMGSDWTLYCLDIAGERAVFVQVPPGTDLGRAPFLYQSQYEAALRAAVVPLARLGALAAMVPAPRGLAVLFSTGRCGSTLASRIFARIPGVHSLSEPDCLTNLAFARAALSAGRTRDLLRDCLRLLGRAPPGCAHVVIKPRSEAVLQAAAYAQAAPGQNAVFLYRGAEDYAASLYRFAQRMTGAAFHGPGILPLVWERASIGLPYAERTGFFPGGAEPDVVDMLALSWRLRIEGYLVARSQNLQMVPIHYDDLNADRRAGAARLLSGCGIAAEHLELALTAFERDAHEGGQGANAVPAQAMDPGQRARVRALVQAWGLPDCSAGRLPER